MAVTIFQERASKGIVHEYHQGMQDSNKQFKEPPFLYDIMLKMAEVDPVIATALDLTVDLATYQGYTFLGKNKREIEKAEKIFNDELDFDQVIDNIIYQTIVYGDAYLEIRWNEGKTKVMELNPRDTKDMRIDYDKHGEINGYWEIVPGKGKEAWIHYEKDEIIYFRTRWIGSLVYSRAPFQAIAKDFATNVYANDYLASIFRNLPPKIVYFLKSSSETNKKNFVANLIEAKTNPNIDIIMQGEGVDAKTMNIDFDNGLIKVLEWIQKRVLMITRVPPVWVGILDGANRGIAENVVIPYETKIKKIHAKIASQINRELMGYLGLKTTKFKWNAISLMDEKIIIEMMNFLNSQGFDGETIIEYAREHGLKLREGAKIEKVDTSQTEQNATAPSRMGENKKTDKMTNNLDKKGVSAEGAKKLEEKKVEAR